MVRKLLPILGILAALFIVIGTLGISACLTRPDDLGLVDGALRPCPTSPNCVRSEAGSSGRARIEPLEVDGDPKRAFQALVDRLGAQEDVQVAQLDPTYAHLVFTTSLLRFRDDLELRLDEAAGKIHVRSASRVGHSDLGANRARVERIRSEMAPSGR